MSILRQIRQEWVDFLEAIPWFDDITILPEDKDDIQNEHERALGPSNVKGEKAGVCVVIMTVTASPAPSGGFGPVFKDIKMLARAYENVEVNRNPDGHGTGKTYEEIAERIAAVSENQFKPLSANEHLTLTDPGIVLGNDPNWPCKDVFMTTSGSLAVQLPQLPAPNTINAGGTITLTCDTPGAAIFYTLDGSRPNPDDFLYLGPITPEAGATLKARAWLAGKLTSPITTINL